MNVVGSLKRSIGRTINYFGRGAVKGSTMWFSDLQLLEFLAWFSRNYELKAGFEQEYLYGDDLSNIVSDNSFEIIINGSIHNSIAELGTLTKTDNVIVVNYTPKLVNSFASNFVNKNQDVEAIVAARHEHKDFQMDASIWARIYVDYFSGKSAIAVLGKDKNDWLDLILGRYGVVWFNFEGGKNHMRDTLERAYEMNLKYLGIFLNASRKEKDQKIGIGAAEWSVKHNLPVRPFGISYDENNKIVKFVIGQEIKALRKDQLIMPNGEIKFCTYNKFIMKKYCYEILCKTFTLVGEEIPMHYTNELLLSYFDYLST